MSYFDEMFDTTSLIWLYKKILFKKKFNLITQKIQKIGYHPSKPNNNDLKSPKISRGA